MTRRFVALTAAAVLLTCSADPSFADHHGDGHGGGSGGWHGGGVTANAGGWHGGAPHWNGGGWPHGAGAVWHSAGGGWHDVGGNWNGGWHGGGWQHHDHHSGGWGVGPAIGLGVGLGLLGGALAAAPYYGGSDYSYDHTPYAGTPGPTVWYWCDTYQGYYPAIPECPVPWREVVQ
jgi:hypothetical protein